MAAFLELPANTVKARLQRGREALREALEKEFDHKVRAAVQEGKRGKKFTQKVMSVLPLVPWSMRLAPVALARLGWGLLGLSAVTEVALLSLLVGWWSGSQLPFEEPLEQGIRVKLEWAGLARTSQPAASASLFGGTSLSPEGRSLQEEALRQGKGGQLVWDFARDAQGWQALSAWSGHSPEGTLPTWVHDGIMRISLSPDPKYHRSMVELVSPELGYDTQLFDQVQVRARLVHETPLPGRYSLTWTTPLNRLFPGSDPRFWVRRSSAAEEQRVRQTAPPSRFAIWDAPSATFSQQWHDLVIKGLEKRPERSWSGELVDVRLGLGFAPYEADAAASSLVLEIDRIALGRTHTSDPQELPLPELAEPKSTGQWLEQGRFYPLGQYDLARPLLGDLDGDKDLDLILKSEANEYHPEGFLTAFNDGEGRFAMGELQVLGRRTDDPNEGTRAGLCGADVNGDDLLDLIVSRGINTQILINQGKGVFKEGAFWDQRYLVGAGDVDGDGDVDLGVASRAEVDAPDPLQKNYRFSFFMLVNNGQGQFSERATKLPGGGYPYQVEDLDGDGRAELVYLPPRERGNLNSQVLIYGDYAAGSWKERASIAFQRLPETEQYTGFPSSLLYLGDLDADGQWEVGVPGGVFLNGGEYAGVRFCGVNIKQMDSSAEEIGWLPRQVHLHLLHHLRLVAQVWDLNRDGVPDPIFLNVNYRYGPHLLVLRGQKGRWPAEEGSYTLPATPGGWAAGDVDRDGDVDLVVAVKGVQGAGVCVFRNHAQQQVAGR